MMCMISRRFLCRAHVWMVEGTHDSEIVLMLATDVGNSTTPPVVIRHSIFTYAQPNPGTSEPCYLSFVFFLLAEVSSCCHILPGSTCNSSHILPGSTCSCSTHSCTQGKHILWPHTIQIQRCSKSRARCSSKACRASSLMLICRILICCFTQPTCSSLTSQQPCTSIGCGSSCRWLRCRVVHSSSSCRTTTCQGCGLLRGQTTGTKTSTAFEA